MLYQPQNLAPYPNPSLKSGLPAVLLARPAYAGTLAAARDLGQDHIPVTTLATSLFNCARWSRYVRANLTMRGRYGPERLFRALDDAAASQAGHVLLPVCDISAWAYAAHAGQLAKHYLTYAPPLETLNRLLDKTTLEEEFAGAGISLLKSWLVHNEAELEALREELVFPLIAKPRAHVGRSRNDKGEVVHDYAQLLRSIRNIACREDVFCEEGESLQNQGYFFQQFIAKNDRGVLSVCGFIDKSGQHFVARAARKVMLRTEPAGVGVCFESVELDAGLADAIARLCRNTGYFGVFEVEFLWDGERWAAIDFNPRFYNQMALDIARGIPLARLCYYDALGDHGRLAALVAQAHLAPQERLFLRDGYTMALLLVLRTLTGKIKRADRAFWRQWNRQPMIDLILAADDPFVWPVRVISENFQVLRRLALKTSDRLISFWRG